MRKTSPKEESDKGIYVISVAAMLAQVHPQTLRIYERKGLLKPERTSKNTRRYSEADISRLRRIQELTQIEGLNLSGVKKVLELEEEIERLHARISELELEMEESRMKLLDQINEMRRSFSLSLRGPSEIATRRKR
ncbi:MAG: MerR family transcriptional regulator [Actinomycetota bacterium]|nr:MerR family transcriptional regulator [Actinomycetota bacterium]